MQCQIDGGVRHLDVGSTHPGAEEGPKGMAVRHLKCYVSWVQTVEKRSFSTSGKYKVESKKFSYSTV